MINLERIINGYGYMAIWLWLYGYMAMAIWLWLCGYGYGYIAIWLCLYDAMKFTCTKQQKSKYKRGSQ
jgi:hypothetical protein